MSQSVAEAYPADGPEWLSDDEIAKVAAGTLAIMHESYAHDLADVRKQFFGLLAAQRALQDGYGWAIYNGDEDGSVAVLGARDVLLLSNGRAQQGLGNYPVPLARITTNELFMHGDAQFYLSEDITILPDGTAAYFISSLRVAEDDCDKSQDSAVMALEAPLFTVSGGNLAVTPNMYTVTPTASVRSERDSKHAVWPFGDSHSLTDQAYALEKAKEILESIADTEPTAHHEF